MIRFLTAILLCLPLLASAQPAIVRTVDTIAQMVALNPMPYSTGNKLTLEVLGYSTANDGGGGTFAIRETASSTNLGTVFASTRSGYQWHRLNWDGNVAAFGVLPTPTDCSDALNSAITFAASLGTSAKIKIAGDYGVSNSIVMPSNSSLEMAQGATIVRNFRSDTGGFAQPQEATIKNSGLLSYQTLGELEIVNTNITLRGFRARTDHTNNMGFHVYMQGVGELTLDKLDIGRTYRAWAVGVAASNWVASHIKIRNGGHDGIYVYQDGLHITGGRNGVITAPDIVSGDDALAFGQHSMPIRKVSVIGGSLRSTHAHMIRGFIGYDYATNYIEDIGIYNVTGQAGIQNGMLRTETVSTNVFRPFRNWVVNGLLADTLHQGNTPIGFEAGLVLRNLYGANISHVNIPNTIQPNVVLEDSDNITISQSVFGGTRWSTYNQNARIYRNNNVKILDSIFKNENTDQFAHALQIVNNGRVRVEGNQFETVATCISISGTNSNLRITDNRITASGGSSRPLTVGDYPSEFEFSRNDIETPSTPLFPGGAVPDDFIVTKNIGYFDPNTPAHFRTNGFGPHLRFVQSAVNSTNALYSSLNQFRLKSEDANRFYQTWDLSSSIFQTIGNSAGVTNPLSATLQAEGASAITNGVGGNLTIRPGQTRGLATPPAIIFQLYVQGDTSNTVAQSTVEAMRMRTTGLTTNQTLYTVSIWDGSGFLERKQVLTNIGGINYWIHP